MLPEVGLFVLLFLAVAVIGGEHKVKKRSVPSGSSDYFETNLKGPFVIQNVDSGYCLKASGSRIGADICDKTDDAQKWTLENPDALKNKATLLCITVNKTQTSVFLGKCSTTSGWKCDGRLIKHIASSKCINVNNDKSVSLETCNNHQNMIVYGSPNLNICVMEKNCPTAVTWNNKCCTFPFIYNRVSYPKCTSVGEPQDWCSLTSNYDRDRKWEWCHGSLGRRTKDPNYYLFESPMFHITWPTKYVKVFLVYNKDYFLVFKNKYGSVATAKNKIKAHAMESIEILDKAYKQINVRMLLSGYEVWDTGDKISVTQSYRKLKQEFRMYSHNSLRKMYHIDTSVFIYGGSWDLNAGGAGMGDMCGAKNADNEIFVMVMRRSVDPHSLANILSHEFGHQFHQGHNFEPAVPCPTYRLYGTVCTMGGNGWPKGFSANFLYKIRVKNSTCLDKKPHQSRVVGCGNGIIEQGEECDCGSTEACKNNHPCCDGKICKLKGSSQCSTEQCCSNCKYDAAISGCAGVITTLSTDSGNIVNPSINNYNVHLHWKISVSITKRIRLFFKFDNFEFREGCPYDYIEVRDFGNAQSLIGRYCRTPHEVFVESTSNELLVTYHADNSYASSFNLYYNTMASVQDSRQFYLQHYGGKFISFDATLRIFRLTSKHTDLFELNKHGIFVHLATMKCFRPRWHGYRELISLTADCSSPDAIFTFTTKYTILHANTRKCIRPSSGREKPAENGNIEIYGGCDDGYLTFTPIYKDDLSKRAKDCKYTIKGQEYRGVKNATRSGKTCQQWNMQAPHSHPFITGAYPNGGLSENYCRNPDGEPVPWCYIIDAQKRWDFCDIPICSDAKIITCKTTTKGAEYRGTLNVTRTGLTCQAWHKQTPYSHNNTPQKFPNSGLLNNFCRNPDGEPEPWCYTTSASKRWEYCDVPMCNV